MSTSFRLSGAGITSARVTMPLRGPWVAEVETGEPVPLGSSVTLALPWPELAGTVVPGQGGTSFERQSVRVIGGAGKLGVVLKAQHYYQASVRQIALGTLQAAGEQLAPDSDAAVLALRLGHWMRASGTAGTALAALAARFGIEWRVLPSGSVQLAAPAWTPYIGDAVLIDEDLVQRTMLVRSEGAAVQPGEVVRGRKVVEARHEVRGAVYRSWLSWTDDA